MKQPTLPLERSPILAGARAYAKVPKEKMVDTMVDTRLTRMLNMLENGNTQAGIAREFGVSREAIRKAVNRMKEHGLISESPESTVNHKFYRVNYRVNPVLGGPDKTPNFDLHNIQCVIPIRHMGRLPQGNIPMNNWKYAHLDFGFFYVTVNYGKEPNLMIYPPKEYGDNIAEVLVRVGAKIDRLAKMIVEGYQCKLDMARMEINRKPHLHPHKDPIMKEAEKLGIQYTGKNITIDESGGPGDVIGFDSIRKYDNLLDVVPQTINEIRELVRGSMATNNAIANSEMLNASTLKRMADQQESLFNLIIELTARKVRRGHIITKRRGA